MKRFIALSLLSFILLPVYSVFWESNELGQHLRQIDAWSDSGWVLSSDGNESELFYEGTPVFRRGSYDGYDSVIYQDGREERTEYENGLAVRQIIKDGNDVSEYSISYDDGSMSGYIYSMNGEVRKRVEFTSFRNSLLSVSGDEAGYYGSDFYSYEIDGDIVRVQTGDGGKLLRSDDRILEKGDDGLFRRSEDRNGTEWTLVYDSQLALIREYSDSADIRYEYENGKLAAKRSISDGILTLESYDDGRFMKAITYNGDSIQKERTVMPDGRIEEIRYLSSVPRYRFIYDADGVRLLEAEIL